jgi:putative endonuclease
MEHRYFVYILAGNSRTLYIGTTRDLETRVREHRSGIYGGFTADYKMHRLVYYKQFLRADAANNREKQLKRWRRAKRSRSSSEKVRPGKTGRLSGVGRRRCKSILLPGEGTAGPSTHPLKRGRLGGHQDLYLPLPFSPLPSSHFHTL